MKLAFPIIVIALAARASLAETVESVVEWRPACDGATIEVVSDLVKVDYRRLEMGDDRAKQVVERLESIKLQDVAIIDTVLAEALEALRVKAVGEKKEGVINHLLRGLPGNQKVTIKAGTISYAKAIDEICVQIGRRWRIEFLELTGPSLVIF